MSRQGAENVINGCGCSLWQAEILLLERRICAIDMEAKGGTYTPPLRNRGWKRDGFCGTITSSG